MTVFETEEALRRLGELMAAEMQVSDARNTTGEVRVQDVDRLADAAHRVERYLTRRLRELHAALTPPGQ